MVLQISQIFPLAQMVILCGIVKIEKGVTSEVKAILEQDASFFIEKSKSSKVTQNISIKENLQAPVEKDEIIGEVRFSVDSEVIKTINVVASDTVNKLNLINMTTHLYNNWFKLMR